MEEDAELAACANGSSSSLDRQRRRRRTLSLAQQRHRERGLVLLRNSRPRGWRWRWCWDGGCSSRPPSAGVALAGSFVACEVCKQVSNYSLQYHNGGSYPVPRTFLVVCGDALKLVLICLMLKCVPPRVSRPNLLFSLRLAVPGLLYALNSNIYLVGLTYVAPTIWLILTSARTVFTALTYKFLLSRPVSGGQFCGVLLIAVSIALVKLPDLLREEEDDDEEVVFVDGVEVEEEEEPRQSLPADAILLALLSSMISVAASVYSELLFKRTTTEPQSSAAAAAVHAVTSPSKVEEGGELAIEPFEKSSFGSPPPHKTFLEQQFWMYLYGVATGIAIHLATRRGDAGLADIAADFREMSCGLRWLFASSVLFDAVGGIVVASILRSLDNVVKEYSGSVANVLLAFLCARLFPDKFALTEWVALSLATLLGGIYLYERNRKKERQKEETVEEVCLLADNEDKRTRLNSV